MRYAPFLLAALTLLPGTALSEPPASLRPAGRPTVEMVFVLDTTGSMGGLIEGAKARIWGIVNEVMRSPARPAVRIGLVAYRDHGDAYVTRPLPLTSDLDQVYAALMEYRADGGGDTPEDVRQALADGVEKVGWAPRSRQVAQVLFLVGDAPPHDDYANEPDVVETTARAVSRGIIVNTIQCGNTDGTQAIWQRIARAGEGEYFAIAQDGGVQAIATPYDRRLSELGGKIGTTYMAFGGGSGAAGASFRSTAMARQATLETKVAAEAPAGASADRAVNKAINSAAYDTSDLVQAIESGKMRLEKVKTEDLPDSLQKLSRKDQQREIDRRIAERRTIRKEILALSQKRDAYVANERRKRAAPAGKQGFDAAVAAALRKQLARKGIRL